MSVLSPPRHNHRLSYYSKLPDTSKSSIRDISRAEDDLLSPYGVDGTISFKPKKSLNLDGEREREFKELGIKSGSSLNLMR